MQGPSEGSAGDYASKVPHLASLHEDGSDSGPPPMTDRSVAELSEQRRGPPRSPPPPRLAWNTGEIGSADGAESEASVTFSTSHELLNTSLAGSGYGTLSEVLGFLFVGRADEAFATANVLQGTHAGLPPGYVPQQQQSSQHFVVFCNVDQAVDRQTTEHLEGFRAALQVGTGGRYLPSLMDLVMVHLCGSDEAVRPMTPGARDLPEPETRLARPRWVVGAAPTAGVAGGAPQGGLAPEESAISTLGILVEDLQEAEVALAALTLGVCSKRSVACTFTLFAHGFVDYMKERQAREEEANKPPPDDSRPNINPQPPQAILQAERHRVRLLEALYEGQQVSFEAALGGALPPPLFRAYAYSLVKYLVRKYTLPVFLRFARQRLNVRPQGTTVASSTGSLTRQMQVGQIVLGEGAVEGAVLRSVVHGEVNEACRKCFRRALVDIEADWRAYEGTKIAQRPPAPPLPPVLGIAGPTPPEALGEQGDGTLTPRSPLTPLKTPPEIAMQKAGIVDASEVRVNLPAQQPPPFVLDPVLFGLWPLGVWPMTALPKEEAQMTPAVLIQWAVAWMRHNEPRKLSTLVGCSVATAVFTVVVPVLLAVLLDSLVPQRHYAGIVGAVVALLIGAGLAGWCAGATLTASPVTTRRFVTSAHLLLAKHMSALPQTVLDRLSIEDTEAVVKEHVAYMERVLEAALALLPAALLLGLMLVTLLVLCWPLFLVLAVLILPPQIYLQDQGEKQWLEAGVDVKKETGALHASIVYNLRHTRVKRLLGLFRPMDVAMEDRAAVFLTACLRQAGAASLSLTRHTVIDLGAIVAAVLMGACLLAEDVISVGRFVGFFAGAVAIKGLIASALNTTRVLLACAPSVWQVLEALHYPAQRWEQARAQPGGPLHIDCSSVSRVVDLSSAQDPSAGLQRVLEDLTLRIPAGSKVGIVGTGEAGRHAGAALIELLARTYPPSSGGIVVGGFSLNSVDHPGIVSVMESEDEVLDTTIAENIRYGLDAEPKEVQEAARSAALLDEVSSMAHGLDTQMGPGGALLPASLVQRVLLARALLRRTAITLLRFPTSMQPVAATREIGARLRDLHHVAFSGEVRPTTVVAVTRSLELVQDWDLVLVMNDCLAAEYGPPRQLEEKLGLWYNMRQQQQGIVLSDEGFTHVTPDFLRRVWLFAALPEDMLLQLCDLFREKVSSSGDTVVRAATRMSKMMVVAHGSLVSRQTDPCEAGSLVSWEAGRVEGVNALADVVRRLYWDAHDEEPAKGEGGEEAAGGEESTAFWRRTMQTETRVIVLELHEDIFRQHLEDRPEVMEEIQRVVNRFDTSCNVERMASVWPLVRLQPSQMERLLQVVKIVVVGQGQVLFQNPTDPCKALHIIMTGSVLLESKAITAEGRVREMVEILAQDSFFGEETLNQGGGSLPGSARGGSASVLDADGGRTAATPEKGQARNLLRAVAKERCTLLVLDQEALTALQEEDMDAFRRIRNFVSEVRQARMSEVLMRRSYVLSCMPPKALHRLAVLCAKPLVFAEGAAIITRDLKDHCLYTVLHGSVLLSYMREDGSELLREAVAGMAFNEEGLLDRAANATSGSFGGLVLVEARAMGLTVLQAIPQSTMRAVTKQTNSTATEARMAMLHSSLLRMRKASLMQRVPFFQDEVPQDLECLTENPRMLVLKPGDDVFKAFDDPRLYGGDGPTHGPERQRRRPKKFYGILTGEVVAEYYKVAPHPAYILDDDNLPERDDGAIAAMDMVSQEAVKEAMSDGTLSPTASAHGRVAVPAQPAQDTVAPFLPGMAAEDEAGMGEVPIEEHSQEQLNQEMLRGLGEMDMPALPTLAEDESAIPQQAVPDSVFKLTTDGLRNLKDNVGATGKRASMMMLGKMGLTDDSGKKVKYDKQYPGRLDCVMMGTEDMFWRDDWHHARGREEAQDTLGADPLTLWSLNAAVVSQGPCVVVCFETGLMETELQAARAAKQDQLEVQKATWQQKHQLVKELRAEVYRTEARLGWRTVEDPEKRWRRAFARIRVLRALGHLDVSAITTRMDLFTGAQVEQAIHRLHRTLLGHEKVVLERDAWMGELIRQWRSVGFIRTSKLATLADHYLEHVGTRTRMGGMSKRASMIHTNLATQGAERRKAKGKEPRVASGRAALHSGRTRTKRLEEATTSGRFVIEGDYDLSLAHLRNMEKQLERLRSMRTVRVRENIAAVEELWELLGVEESWAGPRRRKWHSTPPSPALFAEMEREINRMHPSIVFEIKHSRRELQGLWQELKIPEAARDAHRVGVWADTLQGEEEEETNWDADLLRYERAEVDKLTRIRHLFEDYQDENATFRRAMSGAQEALVTRCRASWRLLGQDHLVEEAALGLQDDGEDSSPATLADLRRTAFALEDEVGARQLELTQLVATAKSAWAEMETPAADQVAFNQLVNRGIVSNDVMEALRGQATALKERQEGERMEKYTHLRNRLMLDWNRLGTELAVQVAFLDSIGDGLLGRPTTDDVLRLMAKAVEIEKAVVKKEADQEAATVHDKVVRLHALEMKRLELLWSQLDMNAFFEITELGVTDKDSATYTPDAILATDLDKMDQQAGKLELTVQERRAEWEAAVHKIKLCWRALNTAPEDISTMMKKYRTNMLFPATLEFLTSEMEQWNTQLDMDKPELVRKSLVRLREQHVQLGGDQAAWKQILFFVDLEDENDYGSFLKMPVEMVERLLDTEEEMRKKLVMKHIVDMRVELEELWAALETPEATIKKVLSNMGIEPAGAERALVKHLTTMQKKKHKATENKKEMLLRCEQCWDVLKMGEKARERFRSKYAGSIAPSLMAELEEYTNRLEDSRKLNELKKLMKETRKEMKECRSLPAIKPEDKREKREKMREYKNKLSELQAQMKDMRLLSKAAMEDAAAEKIQAMVRGRMTRAKLKKQGLMLPHLMKK